MSPRTISTRSAGLLGALALGVGGCGGTSTEKEAPAKVAPAGSILFAEAQIRPSGSLRHDVEDAGRRLVGGKALAPELERARQRELGRPGAGRLDFRENVEPWLGRRAALFVSGVRG